MEATTTGSVTAAPPALVLPTSRVPARQVSPRELAIFSKPKVGKTSLLAELQDCLILDLQRGTHFIDAMAVDVASIADLAKIRDAIKAAGFPYKYVAIDTVTDLENICIPYAEELYSKTPMGKNWFTKGKAEYGSLLHLPNGAGYPYLRKAFENALQVIRTFAPRIILCGHIKDTQLEKADTTVNVLDIDLTGKLKRTICADVDTIGYIYRKGNKNYISFKTSDEVACGARQAHLRNEEFVISEMDDKGNLTTWWEKIYID